MVDPKYLKIISATEIPEEERCLPEAARDDGNGSHGG
jgi:hypothetical protein